MNDFTNQDSLWGLATLADGENILNLHYQLTCAQAIDPDWLTDSLVGSTRGYIAAGLLLQKAFRVRLWEKMGFASVQDFCYKVMGRSVAYCRNTIKAALVALELTIQGFENLPTCQSQAEELAHLLDEPLPGNPHIRADGQGEKLATAWGQVLGEMAEKGAVLTASFIRKVLGKEEKPERPKKVSLDRETYDAVEAAARREGISAAEWLRRAALEKLADTSTTEEPDPEKEAEWEKDLEDLVAECDRNKEEEPPKNGLHERATRPISLQISTRNLPSTENLGTRRHEETADTYRRHLGAPGNRNAEGCDRTTGET